MNLSEPIESITASMDAATREAYAGIKKGASFSETITLYLSFIDYAKQKNEHSPIYADAAEMLALTLKAKLPDGIDTDKIAAAIAGSIGEAYDDTMTECINEAREMQDTLTNFDNMADFEADLDKTLATTRHKLKNVFARIHGIKQESTAASTICEYIEDAIGSPTDGDSRGAADDLLAALAQDAPNKETEAVIDAARFILQGEDDGNPADTIREQLCSVVGYSTDGKTDAMLDETLEALADMATDSALTAVMQAARDILKTDATA